MKQAPSNDLFVVDAKPPERGEAIRRLSPLGTVKPLEGSAHLLLLSAMPSSLDAESVWSRARRLVGKLGSVFPVLLDEDGEPHFPTGEISVRFKDVLPDERLETFAVEHGLRLRDRNKLVPQQVVFRPADPSSSYLPRLIQELAGMTDTKAVWANTLSRFQRLEA